MIYVQLRKSTTENADADGARLFDPIDTADARPEQRVVSLLEGGLLRSSSTFPYFFLVALEAGSPLRALLLLAFFPIVWILTHILQCRDADIRLYAFVTFAGLHDAAVRCVARAVLPKAFLDDVHRGVHRVFATCDRRYVVTSLPRVMVESFAKSFLETEHVLGSELHVTRGGWYTGLVRGIPRGRERYRAVKELNSPDIGIGSDSFAELCKKAYIVGDHDGDGEQAKISAPPLIFHDGRLVHRPTPLWALTILLWLPFAIPLAITRILLGICLPKRVALPVEHLLGVSVRVRGRLPPRIFQPSQRGVLFVLSHRTLLDPVFISFVMGQAVAAVTYSLSRVSELFSPIRTARLTRCKDRDARSMTRLLAQGHLAVCPEGTTCRQPCLLRFSALFAELTDTIVPVSLATTMPVFHGTSARGWKCLDFLFFFMNPAVRYEMEFLEQLPPDQTCGGGGRSSHDVANHVQRLIADAMGYQCTTLTRKDKYRALAGNDGIVTSKNPNLGL
ncbi:glycerol-3-phosphate acyltransferase 5 [Selaginella moellendorffii]|nr:glycerol-3-phosphate acyltransferase 5 [Selaginella moellendorffii]|eukprot:XP_002968981.2 glycerol-3-phosphate acyltransferase 5 [Selaginella moellendorffii]